MDSAPDLSVVVAIVSDTTSHRAETSHLAGCLRALADQCDPPSMEVIVPYHDRVTGIAPLRAAYPDVRFVPVADLKRYRPGGSREHHDEMRARGLAAAAGSIVALVEDHGQPDRHWARAAVETLRASSAAGVGGAIENGVDSVLNWAVYFCDFGRYQNPLDEGPTVSASDANVAYQRAALEAIRDGWEQAFHETRVNWELRQRGQTLASAPRMVVRQVRQGLRLGPALRERMIWGRSYAASRCRLLGAKRWLYAALTPLLPAILVLRMTRTVRAKGRLGREFLRALPLIVFLQLAWSWGEMLGYLTGESGLAARRPLAASEEPPGESVAATRDRTPSRAP